MAPAAFRVLQGQARDADSDAALVAALRAGAPGAELAAWNRFARNVDQTLRRLLGPEADREDLLPTLRRLQERHPDAEMKWFQRGKLWESPEAARDAYQKPVTSRNRDWRPGGEHRDPRAALEKRKRERNQARRQQIGDLRA